MEHTDPLSPVLAQDTYYRLGRIDIDGWSSTVCFPLALVSEQSSTIIRNKYELEEHLLHLQEAALRQGIAEIRTQVLSHVRSRDDMAILCSVRERISSDGVSLGSASINWAVIELPEGWRVSQIHFNDSCLDPSIASRVLPATEHQP